ncbi:MAG: S-methyl-5-thioribose-1-phosphate isomerase [Myxococcota bacterium]
MSPTVTSRVRAFEPLPDALRVLDQRLLPREEKWLTLRTVDEVADAIRTLCVRGAPLIGGVTAYGMWLAALRARDAGLPSLREAVARGRKQLAESRPTAVNLFYALSRADRALEGLRDDADAWVAALRACADEVVREDVAACQAMAQHGAALLPDEGGVLTHCNTGVLATCGIGSALGVVRAAVAMGKKLRVYADETRPLLQGARLTAWELMQDGIECTVLPDGAAAHLMWRGKIQAAVVGADRVAANGDVANKVGTYSVALACRQHQAPLWVVCPLSTLDPATVDGRGITIEERGAHEVTGALGGPSWAPDGVRVFNPAFDVTPADLVAGVVTETGVARPVNHASLAVLRRAAPSASRSG